MKEYRDTTDGQELYGSKGAVSQKKRSRNFLKDNPAGAAVSFKIPYGNNIQTAHLKTDVLLLYIIRCV